MKAYPIQKLSEVMGGKLIAGNGAQQVESGVATDTREMASGSLFFALTGENFDAHDFE